MPNPQTMARPDRVSPEMSRRVAEGAVFVAAAALTVWSAILVKGASRVPALIAIDQGRVAKAPGHDNPGLREDRAATPASHAHWAGPIIIDPLADGHDPAFRWFNGRPIRPSHVRWMTVTAYTPGPESCAPSDDGITATLHSVSTNAGAMVAADTSVLPFGSLVSIEGYDDARVVPVLDRGGKIRGARLDVLMNSVEEARHWGVRKIPVVVWEYADGDPPTDPRRVR